MQHTSHYWRLGVFVPILCERSSPGQQATLSIPLFFVYSMFTLIMTECSDSVLNHNQDLYIWKMSHLV
jgi:hypothetical protein